MNAIAIRLLVVLVSCSGAMPLAARAQTPIDAGQQPGSPGQADPQKVQTGVSLDRISKLLEERPTPPRLVLAPRLPTPTFRVHIYGSQRPFVPDFAERMRESFPEQLVPRPPRFVVLDRTMAKVEVLSTIRAIRASYYRHKVERARREVEAELAAIKAQQGEAAAGSPPPPKKSP
jgi:hypothetical protein